MIVITEVQREILKAVFEDEVKANEISLNLKKIDERAAEEQRRIESDPQLKIFFPTTPPTLPKGFKPRKDKVADTSKVMSISLMLTVLQESFNRSEWELNQLECEIAQKSKDRFKVPEKKKREINKLRKHLEHLRMISKLMDELLYQKEKLSADLKKIEKGTTSGMIEKHGVNRKTFTENIDSLMEENLIEESDTEKRGEQTWKYYKTTILGKVLIFSSIKVMRQGERGRSTTFSLIDISPQDIAISKETGGLASFDDKLLENADKNWTNSSFFYNYLERLKKFDLYDAQVQERQLAKDLHYDASVLHEQINLAFMLSFDLIDITKMPQRETVAMWGHQEHITEPEYGISIIIPILPEAHFSLTAYFVENEIFDFIADVLTFSFLVSLKIITGNLKVASPATKKLFKDPDLNKFYNNMLNELIERSDDLHSYLEKYKMV